MIDYEAFHSRQQHSLRYSVSCQGVGLHSGAPVTLTLHPAEVDAGITFIRSDLPHSSPIPAHVSLVSETRLGTSLKNANASVATVEHLMAALWGMGVDNVRITLDGPEVPIMDGSSEPFISLIEQAGLKRQPAPRQFIKILEPVKVEIGGSHLELLPYDGFRLEIEVTYNHPQIGKQVADIDFTESHFTETLSEARTFGFAHEVEALRQMGLARGGSLANAIVLDETSILNAEGLRFDDEFVRHKALDCVGDLFLAGYRLQGLVRAIKPGHQINTALAEALLRQPYKWQLVEKEEFSATPFPKLFEATQPVFA